MKTMRPIPLSLRHLTLKIKRRFIKQNRYEDIKADQFLKTISLSEQEKRIFRKR